MSQRRAPPPAHMKEIPALGVASEHALRSAESNASVMFAARVAQLSLLCSVDGGMEGGREGWAAGQHSWWSSTVHGRTRGDVITSLNLP